MEQLVKKQTEFDQLVDAHNKSLNDLEEKNEKQKSLEETAKQLSTRLKELNSELEAKSTLVNN